MGKVRNLTRPLKVLGRAFYFARPYYTGRYVA